VQTKAACFGPDVAPTYCQLCPWSRENCTSTKRTSPFTRFRQAILRRLPACTFLRCGASSAIFGAGPAGGAVMVTGTQPWSLPGSLSGSRRAVLMKTHRSYSPVGGGAGMSIHWQAGVLGGGTPPPTCTALQVAPVG